MAKFHSIFDSLVYRYFTSTSVFERSISIFITSIFVRFGTRFAELARKEEV